MPYILIALLLISTSVLADDSTWLCIGEHGAQVSENNGTLSSESFLNNEKWIITSQGLKYFGSENVIFDICNRVEDGRPVWCERSDGLWGGNFRMHANKVFFMSGALKTKNDNNQYYWIVGRCGKL